MHARQTACWKGNAQMTEKMFWPLSGWSANMLTADLPTRDLRYYAVKESQIKLAYKGSWITDYLLYTALKSFLNLNYSIKNVSSYMDFVLRKRAVIRIGFRAEQLNHRSRLLTATSNTNMN